MQQQSIEANLNVRKIILEVKLQLNMLNVLALVGINSDRKLLNYLRPVATRPQMKEIQPYFDF